jgi:serine/threonine-protein kinase
MSPEQAEGRAADRRTDILSLSIELYEMVAGRLPFEAHSEQAVIHKILHEESEPLTALRAGLPVQLDRIVSKALAKDSADRYQRVEDMLVDLRALRKRLESGELAAARPAGMRRRIVWAALLLVVAAAAGWLWFRNSRSRWAREVALPEIARLAGVYCHKLA